jgi:predicted nucleic acid-binding protein
MFIFLPQRSWSSDQALCGFRSAKGDKNMKDKINFISQNIYRDRILSLNETAAKQSGKFVADQFLKGLKPSIIDCQIAAIAFTNRFSVATRDVKDFANEGLVVINPWEVS